MQELRNALQPTRRIGASLKTDHFPRFPLMVCLFLFVFASVRAQNAPRLRLPMDDAWRFSKGDFPGAEDPAFNDQKWSAVMLPHDWSIPGPIAPTNPTGAAGGFFPAGVGWYRRAIEIPASWKGKRVEVEFEGIYRNSTIFLNGRELAHRPNGYVSFVVDLTSAIIEGKNLLAVRVDNSAQKNSRWYSGSGIYRHVWLSVREPVSVAPYGVFIHTGGVTEKVAKVSIETQLQNSLGSSRMTTIKTTLIDGSGKATELPQQEVEVPAGGTVKVIQSGSLANPRLWSTSSPNLYSAATSILLGDTVSDRLQTSFGVRELKWSAELGLRLNGQSIKLNGGNVHHDNGGLGAAAFDRAEERKIELLLAAGFNAVRTSHNPPSPHFLETCDRLGMLVLDEAFDAWTESKVPEDYSKDFSAWWQRDLDAMVLRDRNHPSVVMWSIGNELPEAYTPKGVRYSRLLADRVRSLDRTRPVTEAVVRVPTTKKPTDPPGDPVPVIDELYSALDIAGYNYHTEAGLKDHERVPGRVIVATETYPSNVYNEWKASHAVPYVLGDYVWTAIDYLGESAIGRWSYEGDPGNALSHGKDEQYPWHGAVCGLIDLNGDLRPDGHYRRMLWGGSEPVYMVIEHPQRERAIVVSKWGAFPAYESWTWPGEEGKPMTADIYTQGDSVELSLNGTLIKRVKVSEEDRRKVKIEVPYAPGELKVVAYEGAHILGQATLHTAGAVQGLRLTPDTTQLHANGEDLSFIQVEAVDQAGVPSKRSTEKLKITLDGPGSIAAVQNADMRDSTSYQGNEVTLFEGKALIVIRSSTKKGDLQLHVSGEKLGRAEVALHVE